MNKEKIKENGSITKGMYIKYSKWLPVVYTPFQDIDAFCSIYCKWKDWIPLILDTMMKTFEEQFLEDYIKEKWHNISERERIEITVRAGRQAQAYRKTFWDAAEKVNKSGTFPFVIRVRAMGKEE